MTIAGERKIFHAIAQWGIVTFIVALPWQTRWIAMNGTLNGDPWAFGTVSFYGVDILLLMLLGSAAIYFALGGKREPLTLRHGIAGLLLILAFLSLGVGLNRVNGLFWFVKLTEGIALLFVLPSIKPTFNWVAHAFMASGLIQAILAIWQFVQQHVVGATWLGMSDQLPEHLGVQVIEVAGDRILRAYGSLPHPNMLGGILVISIIFAVVLFVHAQQKHTPAYALALLVMSGGLWMTFSRQAWIAVLLVLSVMVLVTFLRKKNFPARSAIAVGLILLPFVALTLSAPDLIRTRISGSDRLEERSINERTNYIDQSLGVIHQQWLTGTGIGNYTAFLHSADQEAGFTTIDGYSYQPVHNIYLLIFAELGLFGFLGFLLFLAASAQGLKLKMFDDPYLLATRMSFSALIIIGLFDHYLWSLHTGILLFWLIAALYETARTQISNSTS